MARNADVNFQPFLVRVAKTKELTTEQLYNLASSRGLKLTKDPTRDASRPTHFAWQHQMRRDQFTLVRKGILRRTINGTWMLTHAMAAERFFATV